MSVGSMLVAARSAAGMSVSDVSAATRIRPAVVEAIERDDFSLCGGDAYAKGQLRSIARAVGIDPEPVVATFEGRPPGGEPVDEPAPKRGRRRASSAARSAAPPAPASPHPRVPPQLTVSATPEPSGPDGSAGLARLNAPRPGGRSFNWTAAMLVAILVLVTVGVVSVVTRGSSSGGDDVLSPTPSPTPTAVEPTPTTTAPTTPTPTSTDDTIAQATSVEVTVDVIGDKSWLSVTEGKATNLYEGLVVAGESQTFVSEKKIRVVVGNAGAVTLTVDGEDLGVPGGIGDVVSLEFVPGEPPLA